MNNSKNRSLSKLKSQYKTKFSKLNSNIDKLKGFTENEFMHDSVQEEMESNYVFVPRVKVRSRIIDFRLTIALSFYSFYSKLKFLERNKRK